MFWNWHRGICRRKVKLRRKSIVHDWKRLIVLKINIVSFPNHDWDLEHETISIVHYFRSPSCSEMISGIMSIEIHKDSIEQYVCTQLP